MTTGIERVAAKARSDSKLKFTSLTHHLSKELLYKNLMRIPLNSGRGVDDKSVEETRLRFDKWSKEMLTEVHRKSYKPPPVRRVFIPKPGRQEKRPIGVPTISDRCLQKSVGDILTGIFEQDFLASSFRGRPGVGAHHAISQLQRAISATRCNWVYEADLKSFFTSIDHGWAMRFVEERVGDPRILSLIRRWLKAGVMNDGSFEKSDVGTPQGGSISVIISNIYLHYVLDLWIEKAVKPRMKGAINYVRYLDDFVLCFEYKSDANRFRSVIEKRLEKFSLSLEPTKTKLMRFGRPARMRMKEMYGRKPDTFSFLGFTFYCTTTRKGSFRLGLKTEKGRLNRSMLKIKECLVRIRHLPLLTQHKSIKQILHGHFRYFGVGGNHLSLYRIYRYTLKTWRKCLSRRSQSGRLNWEKYDKILRYYPIPKPKTYLTYARMIELASL